ncbi:MAG: AmmeMemoRadiSam system protein B [Thermoplasmata archaeon]|nr:AmmeMemoRadiSam system protein B [Candidatus Sysuiplasma acidicola]
MRQPAVAGSFYDEDPGILRASIARCFLSARGPGELPSQSNKGSSRRIRGIVVPHAGYVYSGDIAAHAYLSLWKDGLPDTVVVIGPNHYGTFPAVALSGEDYVTPLGVAKIDLALSEKLAGGQVMFNDMSQSSEHSIEVQLPFLQFMRKDVSFVPVCMGRQDTERVVMLGKRLSTALEGRDAVIVASSDFSHYVRQEVAKEKDALAIDRIVKLDFAGLYETIRSEDITMCGYGPVMTMLYACKGTRGTVLAYGHSGEVQQMNDVVGYSAIKIE